MREVLSLLVGFVGLELISSLMHRYLFHGPLWFIHQSHHVTHKKKEHLPVELNDVFSLFFGTLTMLLIFQDRTVLGLKLDWLGYGLAFYGILYFMIHDVGSHRRYLKNLRLPSGWMLKIAKAHRVHHRKVTKDGQGPYGLFFYSPKEVLRQSRGAEESP